ncbi:MAG: hypothetical protein QW146_07585 [Candidatus Bathyarchaeia archaeon]
MITSIIVCLWADTGEVIFWQETGWIGGPQPGDSTSPTAPPTVPPTEPQLRHQVKGQAYLDTPTQPLQ